jgi:hypothetical protein
MSTQKKALWVMALAVLFAGSAYANWSDSFDGGQLNLSTWQFMAFPQVTGTFTQTFVAGADGNYYLAFTETMTSGMGGAAFGAGFGSSEKFKDVRVGATVNVAGDACHNYYGLLARGSYFVDPDGKMTGVAPGVVADCYIMHVNYEGGPANLNLNLEKVVMNQNMMSQDIGVIIPRVENARGYYAELEVVGAGPVYVTGRLYEFKGGPLVAQTPTMVDTDAKDAWEDANVRDKVFTEGISGIFAQNEHETPVGFYDTWDDVSSVSDGPTAVLLSPADGATGVSIQATLKWVEASFATSRQLWFGPAGNLQLVEPAPTSASYVMGLLEPGTTYQWRVDQVGATGTVTGHVWQFTTRQGLVIDDFETYGDSAAVGAAWVDNIEGAGNDYMFLETGTISQGVKALRFESQNQYEPFFTEATRTFAAPQDWTVKGADMLSLKFRGVKDNVEQALYVKLEDAAGNEATATHVANYAVQSETWRSWNIALADFAGVDLTTIAKMTIGVGNGTTSGQPDKDVDTLYIDDICLGILP